jgi:hypothetical protein
MFRGILGFDFPSELLFRHAFIGADSVVLFSIHAVDLYS